MNQSIPGDGRRSLQLARSGVDEVAIACSQIPSAVMTVIEQIDVLGDREPLDPITAAMLELSAAQLEHALELIWAELDRSEAAYRASLGEERLRFEMGMVA